MAIKGFEILPTCEMAAAHDRFRNIVPSFADSVPNSVDSQFGAWHPQEQELDPVSLLPPAWDHIGIAAPAQGSLEREALASPYVLSDQLHHHPTSPNNRGFWMVRTYPCGNQIGVDESQAARFVRKDF